MAPCLFVNNLQTPRLCEFHKRQICPVVLRGRTMTTESTEAKLHNNLVMSPQRGSTPRADSHSICFTWSWIRHANDFIIHLNQTVTLNTGNFIIPHVIRDVITNVKIKIKVTLGRPWRQRVAVEVQPCRTGLCVYLRNFIFVPLMKDAILLNLCWTTKLTFTVGTKTASQQLAIQYIVLAYSYFTGVSLPLNVWY